MTKEKNFTKSYIKWQRGSYLSAVRKPAQLCLQFHLDVLGSAGRERARQPHCAENTGIIKFQTDSKVTQQNYSVITTDKLFDYFNSILHRLHYLSIMTSQKNNNNNKNTSKKKKKY